MKMKNTNLIDSYDDKLKDYTELKEEQLGLYPTLSDRYNEILENSEEYIAVIPSNNRKTKEKLDEEPYSLATEKSRFNKKN